MIRSIFMAAAIFTLAACASLTGADNDRRVVADPDAPDGAIRAVPMPSAPLDKSKTLSRIVFGSCNGQLANQSIWDQVASAGQDLTLFIGDNVYGDVNRDDPSMPSLKAAYMRMAQSVPFAHARAAAPMLTIWDDHDYGANDGGGDYLYKDQSEALFDYVWALPEDDVRRTRPGEYGAWIIGEEGRRVQVIFTDSRYFRSALKPTDERGVHGKERYIPDDDPAKTMLGEAQWAWLARELKKPAELRLLVSTIQVIADGHGWEGWKMLPLERERLYRTIRDSGAKGVVLLSGDRHSAALYRKQGVIDYPLFEATSSSLNLPVRGFLPPGEEPFMEPGPNRLGDMFFDANYGVIDIDWAAGEVEVTIRNETGEAVQREKLDISSLN